MLLQPLAKGIITNRMFNESPMTGLLVGLMVGILVAEVGILPEDAASWCLIAAAVMLFLAAVAGLARKKHRTAVLNWLFVVLASLALMAVGATADLLQKDHLRVDWQDAEADWCGIVADSPQQTTKTWRFTLLMPDDGHKILLSVLKTSVDSIPQVGDALVFNAQVKAPYNYRPKESDSQTSDFDYASWLRRQGYSGQAFTVKPVVVLPSEDAAKMLADLGWLDQLKVRALKLRARLLGNYSKLGLDAPETAVLAALTLGDRSGVAKSTRTMFSTTGASHVLALSGLHLGILVMFLMFLLRPLRFYRWGHWVSVALCVTIVGSFVVITGCSVSVVRSALMLTLALLLGLRDEGFSSLNNVVLAAVIILLVSPQSLLDVGFQLSFMAVFGILFFLPHYMDWAHRIQSRPLRWLSDFVFITIVAQLSTAPIVACTFGRLPLLFLLTNLLVIPCAYVILIGGLLYVLLAWAGPVATCLGWAVAWGVRLMFGGLEWIASLPAASVEVHLAAPSCWLLYVLMLSLFGLFATRRKKYLYFSALSLGLVVTFQVWLA